jgi:hypothetical protein
MTITLINQRRQHTEWSIQQNPVQIFINRTEKIKSGGGFTEVKSSKGPFTVRLFQQGLKTPQDVSTLAGTKKVDKGWGMIADFRADLKSGTNVIDEFDTKDGHFRIINIYPQTVFDQTVGYQCDLEKVT